MRIKDEIKLHLIDFTELCSTHKVKYLYAFGSSTNKNFDHQKSDIDLLVEIDTIDPIEKGEKLIDLWDKLEAFFNRKVDLLTRSSLKNPFLKKSIEDTQVLIYDGQKQKVFI